MWTTDNLCDALAEDGLPDLLADVVPGASVVPSTVAPIGILPSRFKYSHTKE